MSEMECPPPKRVFALQSKRQLPNRTGFYFWTGEDYTSDIDQALQFNNLADAERWLKARSYLRATLQIAEVEFKEGR